LRAEFQATDNENGAEGSAVPSGEVGQTQEDAGSAPGLDLTGYSPPEGFYDELLDEQGERRKPWDKIWPHLEEAGIEGLRERNTMLKSLIQENGITYNVYNDPDDIQRLWTRDLLPLAFRNAEWQQIADAMKQRVHLLNLLAQDFYGPQKLLHEGLYPAQLVLGNPAFLRPCYGLQPRNGNWIHLFAADLARSPDGSWWVLSDRLEAASGLGYTMENRALSSKVMPEWLRHARVERLQGFLRHYYESFIELAPRGHDEPNVALLTPGAANETYFEQSYISRHLGFPLVEGADLTVRDDKCYLKTIEGLQQIHVILRRLDSSWCDPLELRSESLLGVPGLLNAVREGNVTIANTLGTGVLETPAMSAFLPRLCHAVLGEELKIPSVATWWCGQERERNYVLENLQFLVVKPVFRELGQPTFFGPEMSADQREQLKARISKRPELWCAQEGVSRATTPVFQNDTITPRHFLTRIFMVPRGDAWSLMPGGLGRISAESESSSVSMQHGGLSKDIWIVPDKAPSREQTDRRRDARPQPMSARASLYPQLPSRAADNLFWLGRYAERAEHLARTIRVLIEAVIEPESRNPLDGLGPLLAFMIPAEDYPSLRLDEPLDWDFAKTSRALNELIWKRETTGSLANSILQIQRTASSLRERLSNDASQILNKLTLPKAPENAHALEERSFTVVDETLNRLSAFTGVIFDNMTRGHGWMFLELGRRLERAGNLTSLLRTSLVPHPHDLEAILTHIIAVLDSTITYRRHNLNNMRLDAVLDLAVWDQTNPRSIQFQIERIQQLVRGLPHAMNPPLNHPLDKQITSAVSRLGLGQVNSEALARPDESGRFVQLDNLLSLVQGDVFKISDRLSDNYFAITQQVENVRERPFLVTPDDL
jgi:uncharacterized circularly permuted ATP-grasp superfamily protein/uncharacterized alpha-E superfamily protein